MGEERDEVGGLGETNPPSTPVSDQGDGATGAVSEPATQAPAEQAGEAQQD